MLARIRKAMEEREGGFTLIELLVVIIIIGILAAIAIPVFLSQRQKGYDAQAKSDARNLATLEETYMTDNDHYVSAADLATAKSVLTDYKQSANVTAVKIDTYSDNLATPTVATDDTKGVAGFCVQTTSSSQHTFVYDSLKGGLQSGTNKVCP
jgi:type IV pilus assembly protein PilA